MSNDSEEFEEKIDQTRIQDIRGEVQNLRSDINGLKDTYSNDKGNATRKTKYTLGKHKNKILALVGLAFPLYFWLEPETPTIPEWVYVIGAGVLVGCIIGYIPAKYVVNKFVKDTRVPVLDIAGDRQNDVSLYYVPQERVPDMNVVSGELNRITTIKGEGYECKEFAAIEIEGEEHLVAKGTWMGEKTGLELKRNVAEIEAQEEIYKPLAQKGFAYDVMWPHIIQELSTEIANMLTREFEDVAIFKGGKLRGKIDGLIEKYNPNNITDKVGESDLKQEETSSEETLQQMLND